MKKYLILIPLALATLSTAASAQVAQPAPSAQSPLPPDTPVIIRYNDAQLAAVALGMMNQILCTVSPQQCTQNNVAIGGVMISLDQAMQRAAQQYTEGQAARAKAAADAAKAAADAAKAKTPDAQPAPGVTPGPNP